MNAHVWTKMALASALLVGCMSAQAQTSSGSAGTAGQQSRPAPVTGKVSNDPAAVALRPAAQVPAPVTSKATQVAPPANPNEPLFSPAAETPGRAAAATLPAAPKPAESAKQRQPHVDRTEGVKKSSKTMPQPHDKKVSGKPRQTAKGPGKEAAKGEGAKGGKDTKDAHKGKKKSAKQAATSSTVKGAHVAKADAGKKTAMSSGHQASHPKKTAKAHDKAGRQSSAVAGSAASKAVKKTAQHAKAVHKALHGPRAAVAKSAAAKASAPSAKKPAKTTRSHKAAA